MYEWSTNQKNKNWAMLFEWTEGPMEKTSGSFEQKNKMLDG